MNGPFLWYLNRATGLVLLVLFTVVVVLGIRAASAGARPGRRRVVGAFGWQHIHRNLGLLGVVLLALHVVSAVADEYVDIRWWQAFVPFGATYRPVFLAAGALALDILVAVVITALLRQRLGGRGWRGVHQLSYAAWLASVVHTVGIGTDSTNPWVLLVLGVCVGSVVVALSGRFLVGTIRRAAA